MIPLAWEDQCEWHRMTTILQNTSRRMPGPDCAVQFSKYTHTHHLGGSVRVALNDSDDRAGLRGYRKIDEPNDIIEPEL